MRIAFIAAMPEEFRTVACHLEAPARTVIGRYKASSGTASGHDVVVLESGMGFDNAAKAAETLISSMRPDIVVSAGFCGGIAPGLEVGAVVVATRVVIFSGGAMDEVPVELAAAGSNLIARQSKSADRVFGGMFVSTPAITAKARVAAMLPAGTLHPVVEMESAAVAMAAAESGIPFVGIRSVSDPADEELGFSLDEFCDDQLRIRIPRVLLTIMRKPFIIPQLVRLARNSRIAAANLSRSIGHFLASV